MNIQKDKVNTILATDCGSTTTKAILIEKKQGEYRLTYRGEAPTTVEAPFEDVTRGVLNSILEIEELSGRKILSDDKIVSPSNEDCGVDIYISTSSAGGGLQMMVAGVVKSMTGESAQRAALGAGSIVMDILASNDKRLFHEKVKRIRDLRPDMILFSGGVDGGTESHVYKIAEVLEAANPKPRLGVNFKLPVIYAGNKKATDKVSEKLNKITDLQIVENIRPTLESENLQPSRDKIHDLFMEHVMAQAPGYQKLMDWTDAPIMPTPGAVGEIIKKISIKEDISVVGVDIGGATTDVFSMFDGKFNRTVSANLGMSYSICNVLAESGYKQIAKWLPFSIDEQNLTDRISNKMIRPTTIPQSMEELIIEQALAREALRLSFVQHKQFAVSLKGVQQKRTISEAFEQSSSGKTLVNMKDLDLIVGSGGVLSHAPRRNQSFMMMIDSFKPEGITQIAVDSIFMMPQLGVLSSIHDEAAIEVFNKDCLVRLGTSINPICKTATDTSELFDYSILYNGESFSGSIVANQVKLLSIPFEKVELKLSPAKNVDLGNGFGEQVIADVFGGEVGVILDGRIKDPSGNIQIKDKSMVADWYNKLKVYNL